MRAGLVFVITCALTLMSCERDYIYAPTVSRSAVVSGRPASYYRIPPEAPRGDIQIATFGLADVDTNTDEDDGELRALHLRMVVTNNSDRPWTVDTREQIVSLPGNGQSRPAWVTADRGTPPVIEVPPKEKRQIDLFYPLPENMQKESKLPSFDTLWNVQTDTRVVVERTPFERLAVDYGYQGYPYSYRYGLGYGWGAPYWYDPLYYPRGAFYGVPSVPGYYVDHPVMIERHGVQQAPPAPR